ncbi:uncharacterized protein LOC115631169 [Scaptodrosophila lebanonensis]|uniref:Uncharacterized protein LOC115631169 n=1 Tax=Drosophila lebanonensis TaxID=7225 RepID=A0A6J2U5U8_DROLE|nr:uncharacterized protein LOC115631169 [Scaptodrosophila lebanonensis]
MCFLDPESDNPKTTKTPAMITDRHKIDITAILCALLCLLSSAPAPTTSEEVFEVLATQPQQQPRLGDMTTTSTSTTSRQDEVNVLAPNATTTKTTTITGDGDGNGNGDGDGSGLCWARRRTTEKFKWKAICLVLANNLSGGYEELKLANQHITHTTPPRVDYNNEWRPLGHGDPLQKDPTYDYSPPALERVRYWAENNGSSKSNEAKKNELPPEVLRNKTKSEILLLGVGNEQRARQQQYHYQQQQQQQHYQQPHYQQQQQQQHQQAKYAAIRRSYYAPQQQQQLQQPQLQQQEQQQQQYMPHTHLMPPPMHSHAAPSPMKPTHVDYRHNMVAAPSPSISSNSYLNSPTTMMYKPHFYSTSSLTSSSPWMHAPGMSSSYTSSAGHPMNRMSSYADAHHQESMQHYSFSRPHTSTHSTTSYSPNAIHPHPSGPKQMAPGAPPRKPWLHELLQKELVKPSVKPTMPATKYLMGTHPYRPLPTFGISSTYAPVTFVPGPPTIAVPTMPTTAATTSDHGHSIYITPTPPQHYVTSSGFRPMESKATTPVYSSTTTTTTPQPIYHQPSSTQSTRLLIPQTSNLAQRPTVAPAPDLTTDALFSHYKQPKKPLLGPMYLIIEGHSKVKTYGQNELDPHRPKIVPVISKREPVVRIADPNEKRGTVETFQVKHLHTKTTPLTSTTTTTSSRPKILNPTTTIATSTPAPPAPPAAPSGGGVEDLLSLLDNMFADAHDIVAPTVAPTANKIYVTSSTMSTILRPVTTSSTKLMPQQPEPRIGSQAGSIVSLLDDEDLEMAGSELLTTTELPRGVRQIFDYDQLPESRVKVDNATNSYEVYDDAENAEDDEDDDVDDEDDHDEASEALQDSTEDSLEEDKFDTEHKLLKRIDKFVDDVDDGDDDLEDLLEGLSDTEASELDMVRRH